MKKILFISALSALHCFGYDFYNAAENINKNILNNSALGNTYTIQDRGDTVYVNGPNGYFGIGRTSGNNNYYSSWDSDNNSTWGHGSYSGNTYYYNEYYD